MNNDLPPGSSRPSGRGEFTWPPTSDELDAIEVIPLDDTSLVKPVASRSAKLAPRRARMLLPRLPRRDDMVLAGVTLTSVLAIATAAFMQFSEAPGTAADPSDSSIVPVAATAPLPVASLPVMSHLIEMAPIAAAPVAALDTLDKREATPRPRSVSRAAAPRAKVAHARSRARGLASRGQTSRNMASRVEERRRVTPVSAEYARDYSRPRLISPEHGRKGKLVLWVEVRKNGKVGDVDVLSSDLDRKNRSHRDLQRAAISTVKRWRYAPAIQDGAPAQSHVRVVVDINLDSAGVAFTEAAARRKAAAADRAADSVLAAR